MRSNFFLFTNYIMSLCTVIFLIACIAVPISAIEKLAMLWASLLVLVPTVIGWVSYAFKSSFGALICALMASYITLLMMMDALQFFILLSIPTIFYLVSASKQRSLNKKEDY